MAQGGFLTSGRAHEVTQLLCLKAPALLGCPEVRASEGALRRIRRSHSRRGRSREHSCLEIRVCRGQFAGKCGGIGDREVASQATDRTKQQLVPPLQVVHGPETVGFGPSVS